MMYREIMAVCSQIHTKHINTLCGLNVELLNVEPGAIHSIQTRIRIKVDKSFSSKIQRKRVKKYRMCCATTNWPNTLSSPRKISDPGNFPILWSRRSPRWRQPQGLGFKIWEVRYWIQTSCLHSSGRHCLTDCCQPAGFKQAGHSDTCISSSSLQLPLLRRWSIRLQTTNHQHA